MKYLSIILVFISSCSLPTILQTETIGDQWAQYEAECYNDSSMVIIDNNKGTVNENEITFDKDTIWTHKNPDVKEFIKKAK